MKKIIAFIIIIGSGLFMWKWLNDVFLRPNSYVEPFEKEIVAFQKRPIGAELEIPDPLLNGNSNYDDIQLHIFLDISGSVRAASILEFYRKAANSLRNYSPKMYYFATCATQLSDDEWINNLKLSDIRKWRRQKCQLGIQSKQTNLLAPINQLVEDIDNKDKEHLVLIVSDDIHETLKSYSISKNEPSFRQKAKSGLREILSEYNINLNLIKLTGQGHKRDPTCKTIKNYISNYFKEFEVTTSNNLSTLSKTLDNEIRKRLLLSDFNFSRPAGFDYPDSRNCNNNDIDSTYIYNVEKRAIHNHNVFIEFIGYPKKNQTQPINLEKGNKNSAWFGFKIHNTHNFFPVELRIESISACNVPHINFVVPNEYEHPENGQPMNMTFYVAPNSELSIKLPINTEFAKNYEDKPFTNLKIDYKVEYLNRDKTQMQNILDRFSAKLIYNGTNYFGDYVQYCNVVRGFGGLTSPPLLGKTSPWKWWYLPLFILFILLLISLIPIYLIKPKITGWKVFINGREVPKSRMKSSKSSNLYEINHKLLKSALPNHIELIPYKTKFGLNPLNNYRDDLKIKILGPVKIMDRKGKRVKENLIKGAKKLSGKRKHPISIKMAGALVQIK